MTFSSSDCDQGPSFGSPPNRDPKSLCVSTADTLSRSDGMKVAVGERSEPTVCGS